MLHPTPILRSGSISRFRKLIGITLTALALLAIPTRQALAATTITGTVGVSGKYLVTGAPVLATSGLLKLAFENRTAGTNLELCAGTTADFSAGTCAMQLSDSGGPGFTFLTIIDAAKLNGKVIFVRRAVGVANSLFALTVVD
jgi:hypothetical protein